MAGKTPSFLETSFSETTKGKRFSPLAVLKEKRGLSASLPEVLGAVGISILLLGLVGFGIGAGITFSQDSGAKDTLNAVNSAQILHQTKTQTFGKLADLTGGDNPALKPAPTNVAVAVSTDGRNYCAVVESTSMLRTKYWITGKDGIVVDKAPTATETGGVTCPTTVTAASS